MKKKVHIWDVTLRDGEMTPGVSFSIDEKLEIVAFLDEIGVAEADVSFPSSSEQEQEVTRQILARGFRMGINTTALMQIEDIDLNYDLGVREVNINAPMSDIHIEKKFNTTKKEIREKIETVFYHASRKGMKINFVGEDACRANPDYAIETYQRLFDLGADRLMITDTVGAMDPAKMGEFVHKIIGKTDAKARYAIHCHNDFGLAAANTLAAVDAGVQYVTVSVNGLGERAGQAAFEEVVLALEKLKNIDTGVDTKRLFELSQMVERISGIPILCMKPIVGHNVCRHDSSIHVDAMLKDSGTYESFDPEEIGRMREYMLGKSPGKNQLKYILGLNSIAYTPEQLDMINRKINDYMIWSLKIQREKLLNNLAEYRKHFGLPANVFWNIVEEVTGKEKEAELEREPIQ